MSRFRVYPTREQASIMLEHCAHARCVWNLAVEQHAHWKPGRKSAPGFAEQCQHILQDLVPYQDLGPDHFTSHLGKERQTRRLLAQLAALGVDVTVTPAEAG